MEALEEILCFGVPMWTSVMFAVAIVFLSLIPRRLDYSLAVFGDEQVLCLREEADRDA